MAGSCLVGRHQQRVAGAAPLGGVIHVSFVPVEQLLWDSGFRVQASRFKIYGLEFRGWGVRFRVQGWDVSPKPGP
jgi:hypothetical protein